MCKYCKRLEELRKKERDDFFKCIRSHQRYERKLLSKFIDLYLASLDLFDLQNSKAFEEFRKVVNDCSIVFESEVNDDA